MVVVVCTVIHNVANAIVTVMIDAVVIIQTALTAVMASCSRSVSSTRRIFLDQTVNSVATRMKKKEGRTCETGIFKNCTSAAPQKIYILSPSHYLLFVGHGAHCLLWMLILVITEK